MAQYGREHMSRNYVHFTQPFNAGAACQDVDVNLNTSSKYSPLMTHRPLTRTMTIPSNAQQAMSMPMGYSDDINGFQPVPDSSFRQPGHPVHNLPASTASMVLVAEDMSDGRDVYNAANRGYITTYDMSTIRTPLSPAQLHAWQFEEQQRIMDPGLQVPPIPMMPEAVVPIENDGWESQEPARRGGRAIFANMTESERLERRREQNRVSQAKLRKTRDALYEKVCKEKNELQENFEQLRRMYNQAIAELGYFHDKELHRYNAKRAQKGLSLYATFEQLVTSEKDIASQIAERQEQRRTQVERQLEEQRAKEVANLEVKPQGLDKRRSSDEHSHSGISLQLQVDQAPGSSGTDNSATSVSASHSTVTNGRTDDNPFAYTIAAGQASTTQATSTSKSRSNKSQAKPRKAAALKTSPVPRKASKRRPATGQSEDGATSELATHMVSMMVPMDYGQQNQPQMNAQHQQLHMNSMLAPPQAGDSYFMAQAPNSSGYSR